MSCLSVNDGYNKFLEDRKEISNLTHVQVQPTAVREVNIRRVEKLILGKKQIKCLILRPVMAQLLKCCNNYLWTVIVQENGRQQGPKNVNIPSEHLNRIQL
jgi:hypothetical protein